MKATKSVWAGRLMSALPSLLFLFSGSMKLTGSPDVAENMAKFGVPTELVVTIAVIEIVSTLLYLIPTTSVIGAILLTGFLGGAIFTHVRVFDPVYLHVVLGVLVWGGLYLRDGRVRQLIPIRKA